MIRSTFLAVSFLSCLYPLFNTQQCHFPVVQNQHTGDSKHYFQIIFKAHLLTHTGWKVFVTRCTLRSLYCSKGCSFLLLSHIFALKTSLVYTESKNLRQVPLDDPFYSLIHWGLQKKSSNSRAMKIKLIMCQLSCLYTFLN